MKSYSDFFLGPLADKGLFELIESYQIKGANRKLYPHKWQFYRIFLLRPNHMGCRGAIFVAGESREEI